MEWVAMKRVREEMSLINVEVTLAFVRTSRKAECRGLASKERPQ